MINALIPSLCPQWRLKASRLIANTDEHPRSARGVCAVAEIPGCVLSARALQYDCLTQNAFRFRNIIFDVMWWLYLI